MLGQETRDIKEVWGCVCGGSSSSEIFKFNCTGPGTPFRGSEQGPQSLFPPVLFLVSLGKREGSPGRSPWRQQHPTLPQVQAGGGFAGDERRQAGQGPTVVGPMGAAQGGGQATLPRTSDREDGGLGPAQPVMSQAAAPAAVLQTQDDIWTVLSHPQGKSQAGHFSLRQSHRPVHKANNSHPTRPTAREALPAEQPSKGVTRDSSELSHRAGSATPGRTRP